MKFFGYFLLTLAARTNGQDPSTCQDVKTAYRQNSCCGNPLKEVPMSMPKMLTDADLADVVEEPFPYVDGSNNLTGMFIYKPTSSNALRPGLVMYGGPWGEGGGAQERTYAKVYAAKGMIVFLPDYMPEVCAEDNTTAPLMLCLNQYFGGYLTQTANNQRIALLAYDTLKARSGVNPDKIGAIGFCFGGAMALQAARAGAAFEVAVSLHGEYPVPMVQNTGPWRTKYFAEMIGYSDPFIPAAARDNWSQELATATAGTNMTAEVQLWMNAVHAFSIQYAPAFLGVLAQAAPGAAAYNQNVAERVFDKIDFLFESYGLIMERTLPANFKLPEPRAEWGEM